ncbi:hypothetical protein PDE_01033 [Penicillium oxalicum 114-2]|uniref:Uncharacterized protein n=1 Tax=Penicillium oxalicum (strain 114-2 / CGMCC 5302) TaxID=933388 RepID=S8AW41_PENO1|nr:hypothetical protein PDE_01033 [Penicillium oxalicum 114-2]
MFCLICSSHVRLSSSNVQYALLFSPSSSSPSPSCPLLFSISSSTSSLLDLPRNLPHPTPYRFSSSLTHTHTLSLSSPTGFIFALSSPIPNLPDTEQRKSMRASQSHLFHLSQTQRTIYLHPYPSTTIHLQRLLTFNESRHTRQKRDPSTITHHHNFKILYNSKPNKLHLTTFSFSPLPSNSTPSQILHPRPKLVSISTSYMEVSLIQPQLTHSLTYSTTHLLKHSINKQPKTESD